MVDLGYEELDRHIGEICAGKKVVYVENGEGVEVPLLFKHPTHRDKELSAFIYRMAMHEAAEMELPSMAQMATIITERKLFSKEDEDNLASLESRLEGQKAILLKTTRVPARRERLIEIIKDYEKQITDLKLKKESLFEFTKERKATEEKLLYLAWAGTLDPFTEKLYWDTYDVFKNTKEFIFRKRVFVEYTLYHFGIDQSIIRFIARSGLWRIRYVNAMKTSDSLFGRAIPDYTTDQLMLIYWSNFYQSIYDMLSDDRPPEGIIDDDAALDAYMKDWAASKSRDDTAGRAKKNKFGTPSAWDYNETLVMRSAEEFQDISYSPTLKEKGAKAGVSQDAAPMGRGRKR